MVIELFIKNRNGKINRNCNRNSNRYGYGNRNNRNSNIDSNRINNRNKAVIPSIRTIMIDHSIPLILRGVNNFKYISQIS